MLHPVRDGDRRRVRHLAHQDRRFAEPAVPLQHHGIPAVRGGHQALPATEYDVLVGGRGQDAAAPRQSGKAARPGHRSATRRRHARSDLAVLGAQAAGERARFPAALFPADLPEGRAFDALISRVQSNEIIRGKLLSEDGTLALVVLALDPVDCRQQGLEQDHRRNPQDHEPRISPIPGSRVALRRAGDAARNPQRGRARRSDLQHRRYPGGLFIAILFFRRVSFMIVAAFPPLIAILLSIGTLGWPGFSLNMFLNVMTPLIMVISLLRFDAADLRRAGPALGRRGPLHRLPQRRAGGRAGLRADPRHRRHFVSRAAILGFGPDPHLRRGRLCGHGHRADRRAVAGSGVRGAASCATKRRWSRTRASRARMPASSPARLLRLDCGAHGRPSRVCSA